MPASSPPTTRILSDLHFRHPAGFIQELRQIAPLLEGVERVVFNGDSVEARFLSEREQGQADAEELLDFCRAAGVEATLISGNHDPLITPRHHLDLADGSVLAIHGDALFRGLAPWSREISMLSEAHDRAIVEAGHPTTLEALLKAARQAALAVEHLVPLPHHQAQVKTIGGFARQIWPPWRVVRMLESWWHLPEIAARFAEEHRPQAKCIVVGHTHRAGVWKRRDRIVVNTGAFLPWSGNLLVDLCGGRVIVRQIRERSGEYHPSKQITVG